MTNEEKIEALKIDAGTHGDSEMVATCDRALAGDESAIRECERLMSEAAANAAEDD